MADMRYPGQEDLPGGQCDDAAWRQHARRLAKPAEHFSARLKMHHEKAGRIVKAAHIGID
jgi:hypothetical protein